MAAELAYISLLKANATIQTYCGSSPVRVYPFQVPQGQSLPAIVVRAQSADPNDTKTGPSEIDIERVQVLIYLKDFTNNAYVLEEQVRTLLDRGTLGAINGVTLEGSSFEDRDTYKEQLVDREVYVIEHIYKAIVLR